MKRFDRNIERSDADIAHDKRSTRVNTWLNRGKLFFDAATEASGGLYHEQSRQEMELFYGKNYQEGSEIVEGRGEFLTLTYPTFKAYLQNDVLMAWENLETPVEGALETSFEAYKKAYEIEPGNRNIKEAIIGIANQYRIDGQSSFVLVKLDQAQNAFQRAYDVQRHPAVDIVDTLSIYNAGFLGTIAGNYETAFPQLLEAKKIGFTQDGDIYYYMYHCLYAQTKYEEAKEILLEGVAAFPDNANIVEGLLNVYAALGDSNTDEIIPYVEKSIEADPENAMLWMGLGRIYDMLELTDEAIEAFLTAVELEPGDFYANINLGNQYIKKGNEMFADLNKESYVGGKEMEEARENVNKVFRESIKWLENAHKIEPEVSVAVELLKNVYFRFRDESEDMMNKFLYYDNLYKQMDN